MTLHPTLPRSIAARHTPLLSVVLHLLPGLLTGAIYFLLAQPVANLGLPSIVALMAAGVPGILLFQLGVIAWAARTGMPRPVAFREMISYRQPLPWWQFLLVVVAVFVATGLLFSLLRPVTGFFQTLLDGMPAAMVLNMGQEGAFSRSLLLWVTVANGLLVALLFPIVEELYFRGFLLPRMPAGWRGWAPLAHSLLFAVYHVWSPYLLVTRTIGLLPLIYAVHRTRNIYIGMIVHCLVNLLDVVTMVALIAAL